VGSAAEERINYYVVSAVIAILKDGRYGIGLVRDYCNFNSPKKDVKVGTASADIFSAVAKKYGCPRLVVRRDHKRPRKRRVRLRVVQNQNTYNGSLHEGWIQTSVSRLIQQADGL